jgi:hypothetical protein
VLHRNNISNIVAVSGYVKFFCAMQHTVVINLNYPGQAMSAAKSPWATHAFGSLARGLKFTCQDHLIYHDSLQLGEWFVGLISGFWTGITTTGKQV